MSKKRCVYDLTDQEAEYYESLIEELETTRIGLLRQVITPGPIRDAVIKAWNKQEASKND